MACPFVMTRYEWDSPTPRVRKCILCYDQIKAGQMQQPACTKECPTEATIFGEREALLAEARRRIQAEPGKYIDHIWGEHEVGGTSVLYISDVDLTTAGWPARLSDHAVPELATSVLNTVPGTFVTVGAAMAGIHWIIKRRQTLAALTAGGQGAAGEAEENAAEAGSERAEKEGS
jgi:formate dehydrogenase iron-sulfur subunit